MENVYWQKKLLPFMTKMLLGLAFFFFIVSAVQLFWLQQKMTKTSEIKIEQATSLLPNEGTIAEKLEATRLKSLIMLQINSQNQLYHQAQVFLMARTWIRYMGFITGMILAFIGATFILGKLNIDPSELSSKTSLTEVSLKSSSPGILLSVLGSILMLSAILINQPIDTSETAIYLQDEWSGTQKSENNKPELIPLKEAEQKKDK